MSFLITKTLLAAAASTDQCDSFCASQCQDQDNNNNSPTTPETPPEDICVDTCDESFCSGEAWQWWCEQQLPPNEEPAGAVCWRGCNKTCDERFPNYCETMAGAYDTGASPPGPEDPPGEDPTPAPPTEDPTQAPPTEAPTAPGEYITPDYVGYVGTFNKNTNQEFSCDAASLQAFYDRLDVDSRAAVVGYNATLNRWSPILGNDPAKIDQSKKNLETYRSWIGSLDYSLSCSDTNIVVGPAGTGRGCTNITSSSSIHEMGCCDQAILADAGYNDDAKSRGACVPESIDQHSNNLSPNTVLAMSLIDAVSVNVPSGVCSNVPVKTCNTGQQTGWDALFPIASMGGAMIDKKGDLVYNYDNLIRSIETFPAFCDPADGELVCKRQLATLFAHIVAETGANAAGPNNYPTSVHQGLWYNAEIGYNNEINLFDYDENTGDRYTIQSSDVYGYWMPEVAGRTYPGRGVKQLTYSTNYAFASDSLFSNRLVLLEEPDLLMVGQVAFMAAFWFFLAPQPPKPSMLQVLRGDVDNELFNFQVTTNIINGAVECPNSMPNSNPQSANRVGYFLEFAKMFGISDDVYVKNTEAQADACCGGCFSGVANLSAAIYYDRDWSSSDVKCSTVGYQTPWSANDTSGLGYAMCVEHYKQQ